MAENQVWFTLRHNSSQAVNVQNWTNDQFPKYKGGTSIGQTVPFKKGEIEKKKGITDPN